MELVELKNIIVNKSINRYNQALNGFIPTYCDVVMAIGASYVLIEIENKNIKDTSNLNDLLNYLCYGR